MSKKKRDPLAEELQAIAQMPEKLQERAMDMLDKKITREHQGQIFSRWFVSLTVAVSFLFCFYLVFEKEYKLAAEFIMPAILVTAAQVIMAWKQ